MERKARFFLNATGLFTPEEQIRLLDCAGSAEKLLHSPDAFEKTQIFQVAPWQKAVEQLEKQHAYENWLAKGIRFLLREDDNYPPSLRYVDTPPHLLYIKGDLPINSLCGLSIIGTRHPTQYGRKMSRLFARELAESGMTIISGCARGIDSEALKGALDAGGHVIGILGNGIDGVYPPENGPLFDRISQKGCLVSEFPPGARPLKHHFPWRNRLISGWALGLLVVEATIKSGTAGTVRWALDQGKEIFAVPGPVTSEASRGCHRMIREGAHLVEHSVEILDFFKQEIQSLHPEAPSTQEQCLELDENELGLINSPRTIDELMEISGLSYSVLVSKLNQAVMAHRAKKCPGGCYSLPN